MRENLAASHKQQKDAYDTKIAGKGIAEGDEVWLHSPAVNVGQTSKLNCPWKGPYVVLKKMSDVTYRIRKKGGRKDQVVHFNRLKPFNGQSTNEAREPHVVAPSQHKTQCRPEVKRRQNTREQHVVAPRQLADGGTSSDEEEANAWNDDPVGDVPPEDLPVDPPEDPMDGQEDRRPQRNRKPSGWLRDYVTDDMVSEGDSDDSE